MFQHPFEIAFLIIGIIGSLTTILAFLPQCIKTIITKDTSGLSLWFFIIAIISSFFWLILGSMSIASPFILKVGSIASGLAPIITNVITLILNTIIISIKLINMHKAKTLNISEQLYCEQINKKINN